MRTARPAPPGPPPPPYSPPGPYAPGPYTQPGAYPGALQPPFNPLSVAALVVGIASIPLSFCCIGLGPARGIAGLVLGFVARGRVQQSGGAEPGNGLALGGVICGGVGILIGAIFTLLDIVFFGLTLFPFAQSGGGG